ALLAGAMGVAIIGVAASGALSPSGILGQKLIAIPDLAAAPQTLQCMPGFAWALGLGLAGCGAGLWIGKTGLALLALCVPVGISEAINTQGFAEFDRVRSSKRTVHALEAARGFTWVS